MQLRAPVQRGCQNKGTQIRHKLTFKEASAREDVVTSLATSCL